VDVVFSGYDRIVIMNSGYCYCVSHLKKTHSKRRAKLAPKLKSVADSIEALYCLVCELALWQCCGVPLKLRYSESGQALFYFYYNPPGNWKHISF
jgi:hypothetical protein